MYRILKLTSLDQSIHLLIFFEKFTGPLMKLITFYKGGTTMITLCLILLILAIVAVILLALAGIVAIAWPILIVLGIGAIIDVVFLKLLFGRKKK